MVLVDSCIWIEAAKREGDLQVKFALESLLAEGQAALCGPIKLEILGAVRSEFRKKFASQISIVPSLPLNEQIWDYAVRLSWKLRDKGVVVPWNDLLIASLTLQGNMRVYSIDKHFSEISRVSGLALYQPGFSGEYMP